MKLQGVKLEKTTKMREKSDIFGRNQDFEDGRILLTIGDIIHCVNKNNSVLSNHRQGTNLKS